MLFDTNVLVDVLEHEPKRAEWSVGQLRKRGWENSLKTAPTNGYGPMAPRC